MLHSDVVGWRAMRSGAAKPFVVAYATDAGQFPAALASAMRAATLCPRDDCEIAVFCDSLPDLAAAQQLGWPVSLYHLTVSKQLPGSRRLTGAMFYRLFLPELMPDARRILYLDADTFLHDARPFDLFDLDMADASVAAVLDFLDLSKPDPACRQLNSGVMLIDVSGFLTGGLRDRAIANSMSTGAHDQLALSRALQNRWLDLSPAFNMIDWRKRTIVGRTIQPAIEHLVGTVKPWHQEFPLPMHPARLSLIARLKGTQWESFPMRSLGRDVKVSPALSFEDRIAAYLAETRFIDQRSLTPGLP